MISVMEIEIVGFIWPVEMDDPLDYPRLCRAARFVEYQIYRNLHNPERSQEQAALAAAEIAARALFRISGKSIVTTENADPSKYVLETIRHVKGWAPHLSEFKLTVAAAAAIAFDYMTLWSLPPGQG